jgi:tRNA nucleotidyltransferase (CCA-adding enzyme)
MRLQPFLSLATLFEKHGFHLWLVGGSTRDYLLKRPFYDMDCVTDALPSDMQSFLFDLNDRFAHYGHVSLFHLDQKIEITTLRVEGNYVDARHPGSLLFVKEPKQDVVRRDFTVNGLYLTPSLNVLDYVDGQTDLAKQCLRMIGEPNARLQEDPLRIIRAVRFHVKLGFSFEPSLEQALYDNRHFLDQLNPQKVIQEVKKIDFLDYHAARTVFEKLRLGHLGDML